MTRIQPLERNQRSALLRLGNWLVRQRYGQEIGSLNTVARSPSMLLPYVMTSRLAQAKIQLPNETRALVMHLVAARNTCAWCIDFGLAESVKSGMSLEKLLAVPDYATDSRFSAAERAALAYADVITEGRGHVPDEVFNALKPHFSDREIVELTVSIALENFFNRINGPLGIESQGFCAMPGASRQRGGAGVTAQSGTGP